MSDVECYGVGRLTLDVGRWMFGRSDVGSDVGRRTLDVGRGTVDVGRWMSDTRLCT